jgi:hypothetical protein
VNLTHILWQPSRVEIAIFASQLISERVKYDPVHKVRINFHQDYFMFSPDSQMTQDKNDKCLRVKIPSDKYYIYQINKVSPDPDKWLAGSDRNERVNNFNNNFNFV